MLNRQSHLIGLFLPLALVGLNIFASEASAQKARETFLYAPLILSITADQAVINACEGVSTAPSLIQLNAKAISPGGNPIRYRWTTSAGSIAGDGPAVTWDLSGVKPGDYRAFLEINAGGDTESCQAFSSTAVRIMCPPPVCPSVFIICPDKVAVDQPLTFKATVTGGSGNVASVYNWTVTTGRIIEGQGTSSIKVDTTGLGGQAVRATFLVDGYPQDCSASCAVQIPLPIVPSRKFDEFPSVARNDEKARLDNFAVELKNDPTSTAYIIVYPGRSGRSGEVQKHTSRIVDYLVNYRGLEAQRIVILVGPPRSDLRVELWIAPRGATPPAP